MQLFWALHNYFLPGNESEAQWLERAARPQNSNAVAETAWLEGKRVGFLRLSPERAKYREARLGVLPEARGRGVGAALWNRMESHARQLEVPRLMTSMQNPDASATRFLEVRGFQVQEVSIRSHLGLPVTLDMTILRTLETQGYLFFTLLKAGNTPENREKLYGLVRQSVEDDPGFQGEFETLEEFSARIWDVYWKDAGSIFIAQHSEEWVALAGFHPQENLEFAPTTLTGVARAHRGRGLAQALKVLVILEAMKLGYGRMHTANDSRNAAMLGINQKLGFQQVGSFTWFERVSDPRA